MTFIERKVLFIIKSNEDIYKFIFILSKIWDPKLLFKKKKTLLVELIEIDNLFIDWLFATTKKKMNYASPFWVQTSWINYQAPKAKNLELCRKLTIDTFNFKSFP